MILKLHNNNTPDRLALVESTEIASVVIYPNGSIVLTKGGGYTYVAETPEQIEEILSALEKQ